MFSLPRAGERTRAAGSNEEPDGAGGEARGRRGLEPMTLDPAGRSAAVMAAPGLFDVVAAP